MGCLVCLLRRMMDDGTRPWLAEFRQLGHSRNSMRNARRALTSVAAATTATARGLRQRATARAGYNESELGDFVDREDEAIYAEAVRIFRRNLARYG